LEQPGITIALAGARNDKQSVQNAKAAALELTEEEIDLINRELEKIS
jgi:aryl-alcohol dehydrogenase-like predicted oxidoreductase